MYCLIYFVYWLLFGLSATLAGILPAALLQNTPTAISHQSFTRVLHEAVPVPVAVPVSAAVPVQVPAQVIAAAAVKPKIYVPTTLQATVLTAAPLAYEAHYLAAAPAATAATGTVRKNDGVPISQPQSRTPAHLTYAASPIVYKTLPLIKPMHGISFDTTATRPNPRYLENYQK